MFIYINAPSFKKVEDSLSQVPGRWNNPSLSDHVVFSFSPVVSASVKTRNNTRFSLLHHTGEAFLGVEEAFSSNSLICYMFKQLIKYIDMKFSRKHFENIKILQILKLKKINLIQIIQIKLGQFIS